jgi:thioredoxin-related protein
MSKFERVFYVVVILAMFALVILFHIRLRESSHRLDVEKQLPQDQPPHIFSFEGELPDGDKTFVHFTAYSPKYYIFMNSSDDCPHCQSMLQELQTFRPEETLPENIFIYLIAEEFPGPLPPKESQAGTLKVSFEDLYQFGSETPSVSVVDGRGNIIARWKGFSIKILKQAILTIRAERNASSKSLQVKKQ